ncbi:MAG: substrate-binding domain-containing protein [Clostridia bacterium]|nr:substrate-binding domain-containing protein [Clostridia bacterium]
MDNEKENKSNLKNIGKIIFKLILTAGALFASYIVGIYLLLILASSDINIVSTIWSAILLPSLLLFLIYSKNKKRDLKRWVIFLLLFLIVLGINIGINKYEESITIKTNVNINCEEYLPFVDETKIVKLENEASLKLKDDLPIIDGAAAVFPVYSAFVNAVYPNTVELNDGVFEYNNTVRGYFLLAQKETDMFLGGFPSDDQVEFAKEQGTEFVYTEIGKDAFVFFVHKDNPVESLTTEQIKKIYSGEITNWKEVGGNDEEIVAFQRNEGSGSQSMLKRFMDGTPIMEAPTEQVNDFMVGIIDQVSDYKNKTNSIGFSFRYYMEGIIKNPNVKILKIDGIEPNLENIKKGNYPITSYLYAVTYKNNDNENVQKLLDWILSKEGQEIIEKTGYVGIK